MGDEHPNWYALEGEEGQRNTYVAEGWIDDALDDMTYTYRVLVTPRNWTPPPGERRRRRLYFNRLSAGDVSDVSFGLSGRVTSRHRQRLVTFLNCEGVLPGARDDAVAFIIFLYTKTTTYTFAEEALVRIQTHRWHREEDHDLAAELSMQEELRPTPADRDAVEGLEKLVVGPGASMRETSCVVCLGEFSTGSEVIRMPCSHVFHGDCIARWLENRSVCPLCRFELAPSTTESMVLDG